MKKNIFLYGLLFCLFSLYICCEDEESSSVIVQNNSVDSVSVVFDEHADTIVVPEASCTYKDVAIGYHSVSVTSLSSDWTGSIEEFRVYENDSRTIVLTGDTGELYIYLEAPF